MLKAFASRLPVTFKSKCADLSCVIVDRKSTRLNSSHTVISYAVFCLKKKKKNYLPNVQRATSGLIRLRGVEQSRRVDAQRHRQQKLRQSFNTECRECHHSDAWGGPT